MIARTIFRWCRGWCLAPVLVVALAGCPSASSRGPGATLDTYGQALRRGDYASAYGMMSQSFRAKHSREDFVRMMKENRREVDETAARLESPHRELDISAEFRYGLGDTMRLVQERGTWRIASNPVLFYSMASPRDSLRSFVRAYSLRRWEVMLRFVPKKFAEKMDAKKMQDQFEGQHRDMIESMMHMLEANIDEPIEDKGNEARMPYGDRYEVKFVREDGVWKIQDLD